MKVSSLFQKQKKKEEETSSKNLDICNGDDPLDDFFQALPTETKQETGEFSSDDDSDVEEKAKSFIQPNENDIIPIESNKLNDSDNEPEYVLPPDHSKIHYEHF